MKKNQGNILIADDDKDILFTATLILEDDFNELYTASNEKNIFDFLEKREIDILLLDMNFSKGATSGKQGLLILEKVLEKYPEIAIVMSTSFGDIDLAVNAMQKGAYDFITKPWEPAKLIERLHRVLGKLDKRKEAPLSKKEKVGVKNQMVYESEAMAQIHQMAKKVAVTESNVLILGENGTGKGVLATEIHKHSARKDGPFVQIDLGALSESLFEAELFGHAKGAFTDAQAEKKGRIEEANGGTLFLDEIGNLSLSLQAKMLTVVQNKKIVRIGETKERPVDFRLITATNMPLQEMMVFKDGNLPAFRSDLFFRINTVQIEIPPLRERPEDIHSLANYFLKNSTHAVGKSFTLSKEALNKLTNYSWPGNIRELSHVIENAIIFAEKSVILPKDIKVSVLPKTESASLQTDNMKLDEIEKQAIQQLLKKHHGNMTKVAKELGIGRTTLYRKIEKYNI